MQTGVAAILSFALLLLADGFRKVKKTAPALEIDSEDGYPLEDPAPTRDNLKVGQEAEDTPGTARGQETQVEQEWVQSVLASQNGSAIMASLPLAISDCGGSNHIVSLVDYQPKSVRTGSTTVLHVTGTVSDDISGGNMNMKLFMTRFPWTKLGELEHDNICNPLTVELRFLGIDGGKLEWGGINCPVGTGEITVDVELTLSSNIPTGLMNVRAELDATSSDGKPMICSRSTISGR